MNVLLTQSGDLVLLRRPSDDLPISPTDYGPCPDCLGMLHWKHLWIHSKKCHFRGSLNKTSQLIKKRQYQAKSAAITLPFICDGISPKFQMEILLSMKSDEITFAIKKDPLILQLGMLQFEKYGNDQRDLITMAILCFKAGVSKLRPAGQNRSACTTNPARGS